MTAATIYKTPCLLESTVTLYVSHVGGRGYSFMEEEIVAQMCKVLICKVTLQKSGRERSKNPGPMVPCCLSKILVLK
jgi:hypothetical protein